MERFLAYAALGGAFCLGYPKHRVNIILLVIAITGLLEVGQHLVPGRHGRIHDAVLKERERFSDSRSPSRRKAQGSELRSARLAGEGGSADELVDIIRPEAVDRIMRAALVDPGENVVEARRCPSGST